jgi:hypothetical protein
VAHRLEEAAVLAPDDALDLSEMFVVLAFFSCRGADLLCLFAVVGIVDGYFPICKTKG